jgi:superfamily II DNA or RNA helicase
MARLEEITRGTSLSGIVASSLVTVIDVKWFGTSSIELTYKDAAGKLGNELLFRDRESTVEVVDVGRPWSFDGDGGRFRLVSEAHRIRLAHLFDPVLAVHTSLVDPLPHQITAVYEEMLGRQPLRFLLADDPGAGKTIMAGLLIKELIARGDLQRCLIVCPGSLAEQWQDELYRRFDLPFEILTNDKLEAARTGNWFLENNLIIARLDKLSRNDDVQDKLAIPEATWDLIVCDEAHKMSATHFGGEIKYTKRYRLGQKLSGITRHFLLMTATPHNGKDDDFQLFMALLDGDRFEGRFRDGVHTVDVSDLMRRMVKEKLLKFDGEPLFPPRYASTVPYQLSNSEAALYEAVTDYVRQEFNRAEALQNDKRAGTVGFALTILQRRLASSPEAIYQSLHRRKERLSSKLRELELLQRGALINEALAMQGPMLEAEDEEDLDEAPDIEVEQAEEQILDQATAAGTITELRAEIATLAELEAMAHRLRRSGEDRKWMELGALLHEVFSTGAQVAEPQTTEQSETSWVPGGRADKLVIFTEHRDTLTYLQDKISRLLGSGEAVVVIHGGMGREERMTAQELFKHNADVKVLVATDAAGEGINLQRAHLMVNYDLPWNPNRIEQRFGRIHRIGQQESCHLWNLVAEGTREGDVYRTLLDKIEEIRKAFGGQVFDVLGKLVFDGKPLRELLIRAIRDERPEVQAEITRSVENALDLARLQELLEERAIVPETMDISRVMKIREDMERAEARRLQPHYVESFFLEAFKQLGGTYRQRETRRYEITNVPALVRTRDRLIGLGEPVLSKYERIVFDKPLINPKGLPAAAFLCPGHPLLDSTLDLTLERNRDLLKRGAVLVDDSDDGDQPRVMFYLEHALQDGSLTRSGDRRVISKRLLYVEINSDGNARHLNYAPYLDYRPLNPDEPSVEVILARREFEFISKDLEGQAQAHAIETVVPEHMDEVRQRRITLIGKTEAAVKDRLTKEINFWDHRAEQLKMQEQAGKPNARLNSNEARKRADELHGRLQRRMEELKKERQISPLPPVVMGGLLVLPAGLMRRIVAEESPLPEARVIQYARDTQIAAAHAREIVMEVERELGFTPVDRELEKLGYDIESLVPGTGRLRFIEVKGRITTADTITVTKNEILYSLNKPEDFILAIVEFIQDGTHRVHYVRRPFQREPDFGVTSVNYNFAELLDRAEAPI